MSTENEELVNHYVAEGFNHAMGIHGSASAEKAVTQYKKALQLNPSNGSANYLLAKAYQDGVGVKKNISQAEYHYNKAAQHGHGLSTLALGVLYVNANPMSYHDKAFSCFYKLLQHKDIGIQIEAKYYMAHLLVLSDAVSTDIPLALKYWEEALEGGYSQALYHLVLAYSLGEYGVKQDIDKANMIIKSQPLDHPELLFWLAKSFFMIFRATANHAFLRYAEKTMAISVSKGFIGEFSDRIHDVDEVFSIERVITISTKNNENPHIVSVLLKDIALLQYAFCDGDETDLMLRSFAIKPEHINCIEASTNWAELWDFERHHYALDVRIV